ncbi:hypothetical protein [Calidithermus terrae]|nr:hypothetical protein [Calidithermus terrae]
MVGEVARHRARRLMCLGVLALGLSATALMPSPSNLAPTPSLEQRGSSWRPKANHRGVSLRNLLLPEPLATATLSAAPSPPVFTHERPRA